MSETSCFFVCDVINNVVGFYVALKIVHCYLIKAIFKRTDAIVYKNYFVIGQKSNKNEFDKSDDHIQKKFVVFHI